MNVSMETCYTGDHSLETKKNKVIWTPDLHKKFLEAVQKIGVDEAVPKKILELMKVDGLTRDHIASHLQKYRIFLKKLADANNDRVQIASKPSLLESSMINGDPWKNSSLMLNQQKNFPSSNGMHVMMDPSLLDTPSFSFPVLEASSFNPTTSSELALSCSIPNQGYSMQESTMLQQTTPKHLNDVATPGIMSSGCASSSSCVQSLDGFVYDYGGNTTYVQPYISAEMGGSFGDLYSSKELPMNLNHENSSPNANGFESNSSTNGEFFEMGSMYGCLTNEEVPTYLHNQLEMNIDLGSNVQNVLEEDDLILDASYIASLWETFFPEENYVDSYTAYGSTSNNLPVTYEPPNQDVNSQINLPNMASFDPVHNEDHVNKQQHTNEHVNEQLMESVEDGVTLETIFLNSYVQD